MLVCAFLVAHCTRDRGCSAHPVFPAPSVFEGKVFLQNFGRIAPRDREVVFSRRPGLAPGPIRRDREYLARWSTTCLQQLTFVAMGPGAKAGTTLMEQGSFDSD